jgi:O-glycosyl hydrolase
MQKRIGVYVVLTVAVVGVITLTGIAVAADGAGRYKQVKVYLTAKGGADRLADKGAIRLEPMAQPEEANATVMLDASKTFQVIEGFGGAFTDAAAETYAKLPAEARKAVLTAYFDPKEGIGYSLCRTQINSCDFSSGSYAYYYIGHFSKFVRPGAKRILCSSNSDDLLATGFVNPDGSIASVVMNEGERPTHLALWIDGTVAKTAVPAHSIVTLVVTP